MKVTKIDFTTEIIDIPEGQWERRYAKLASLNRYEVLSYDAVPSVDQREYECDVYRVETVRLPTGEKENYLIKAGEKDLAERLFLISDTRLDHLVNDRVEKIYMEGKGRLVRQTKEQIKQLSWWKRLFKKF